MRFTYDKDADAAYIYLVAAIAPGEVTQTRHCLVDMHLAAVNLDFDSEGNILGIEILGASRALRSETLMPD